MIREAEATDLAALKSLVEDAWYWPFFEDDHYATLVADEDGIVGVACVSMTFGTANLDFVFVAEDRRSAGIGARLLDAVRAWCRARGAEGLGVNCGIDNAGARRFYERAGFSETGRVENYFSNGNVQVFYWMPVPPGS